MWISLKLKGLIFAAHPSAQALGKSRHCASHLISTMISALVNFIHVLRARVYINPQTHPKQIEGRGESEGGRGKEEKGNAEEEGGGCRERERGERKREIDRERRRERGRERERERAREHAGERERRTQTRALFMFHPAGSQ